MRRLRFPSLSVVIAMAVGLLVLLGYFVQINVLVGLRVLLLRWALGLAAVALLIGVVNLLRVHWMRVSTGDHNAPYSLIVIVALVATVLVTGVLFSPLDPWSLWIFNYIQTPVEASLMALLAVILAYGAARTLQRQRNLFAVIFLLAALGILLLSVSVPLPMFESWNLMQPDLRGWFQRVLVVPGARGLLLGVVLGTVATGLRVLMGADRPYGG